jgi:hypothetical protein
MYHLDDPDAIVSSLASKMRAEGLDAPKPRPAPAPMLWDLPGFDGRARVFTSFGHLPIAALRVRDPVKTLSGAFRRVQWIDKIRLDEDFIERHPEARPVHLPRSAFRQDAPKCDLYVSPAQALKPPGPQGYSGAKPAERFVGPSGITRRTQAGITYYLFHLGDEQMVSVEGLWFDTRP